MTVFYAKNSIEQRNAADRAVMADGERTVCARRRCLTCGKRVSAAASPRIAPIQLLRVQSAAKCNVNRVA